MVIMEDSKWAVGILPSYNVLQIVKVEKFRNIHGSIGNRETFPVN